MKVLLVDDSMTMRKIQKRALAAMGIEDIIEAANGREALAQIAEHKGEFDFILCDINMPEMDGIETLTRIRENPETKKLPVIMCTSVAEKSQVLNAIKAGASSYVVKPFRPDDLKGKIEAVMTKIGKPITIGA